MTDANLKILNAIPLVDVMRGWGYVPQRQTGATAWYLCPWHDDHNPSLSVDRQVRNGAVNLGFKCWSGRDGHEGFGAIQLAAQLMGKPVGQVSGKDMPGVLAELMSRCDVSLQKEEAREPWKDTLRKAVVGWNEFKASEPQYADMQDGEARYEREEWTEESIAALGIKVQIATRRARKTDLSQSEETKENSQAEIKVGDILTQFNPDTGEALYRCSLDKVFYRDPKKAETRTIREWGEYIERIFGILPISRFVRRKRLESNHGVVVTTVKATRNYPIFAMQYVWGWKKYEPRDFGGANKWTWWNTNEESDLYHRWYADAELTDVLEGAVPQQDETHPFVEIKGDDGKVKKYRFKRVVICSGPRDAIAVWSHSNAHVIWLHSEQAGLDKKNGSVRPNRWLRALLKKLQSVTVEGGLYVCYDEDDTGLSASQAIALNSPNIHWLRLPRELREVQNGKNRRCKDVTDFVTRFQEVEGHMSADLQHDDPVEWFDNALFDTPTTKFWQWESERKDSDGTGRARYKFDLRNTPIFLRARGMVRKVVHQDKETFSRFFLLGSGNTYTEIFQGEKGAPNRLVAQARDLMAEWLRAHKEHNDDKGALSRAIYSAKLESSTLEGVETCDFDEKSFGEDFDHFFFENTAVRIDKNGWEAVPYSQLRWWTNSEAIQPGEFTSIKQPWHIEVNNFYEAERMKHEDILATVKTAEERAQENMRFDQWASLWKYHLVMDGPLEQMPLHFQFLYNTCRIFWEKEAVGTELTKTEKQVQDLYFITMVHAIGSALVRHRSAHRQQFIHITDNGTRREDLASGGTGKTAILELLSLMRRCLSIDGKSLEGGNIVLEQELGKTIPGLHNIVCIDELPQGFSPKKMYNYPLSLTSRGLYKGSVKLTGDDLPKFVVASNEQINLSSDSTSRRVYQVLVSDWYHPRSMDGSRQAHTPADDFKERYNIKEVARNLPPQLLNEARNFLLGCVQTFFMYPDETLCPPRDSRALLRQALAASKDEQFTRWIASYLSDNRHLAQPIAQRELAISLLDYCGIVVGEKTLKAAMHRIRNNLDDYIKTSIFVVNPSVTLLTKTDQIKGFRRCAAWVHQLNADGTIQTDKDGNRLPRVLEKLNQPRTYYFYQKGKIPHHAYDPAHVGDDDYVQAAPETDPEANEE